MVFSSLSIVLPAFNEETRLGPALDELFAYLCAAPPGALPEKVGVLIVDDGSTDGTAALVRARAEYVGDVSAGGAADSAVGATGRRDGGPRARQLGATAPSCGCWGSRTPARARPFGRECWPRKAISSCSPTRTWPRRRISCRGSSQALASSDVALGSRIQPDGSDMRASQPRFRRLVGRLFRVLARLWVTGPIDDTQCGFKGFRRDAARDLFGRLRITSIVFDVDLIFLARQRGYRMAVVPVVWADRRGSRMHARPSLALRVGWDLLRIRFLHRGVKRIPEGAPAK